MRGVIQRVSSASVSVNGKSIANIKNGLVILLGIEQEDTIEDAKWFAGKVSKLRIFSDENENVNFSINEVKGDIILVSQFTLHAKTKKGNRPSFIRAASPDYAEKLYLETRDLFASLIQGNAQTGEFGADMNVELVNNGPVTLIIDTKNKE